jgi:hypothetical protein
MFIMIYFLKISIPNNLPPISLITYSSFFKQNPLKSSHLPICELRWDFCSGRFPKTRTFYDTLPWRFMGSVQSARQRKQFHYTSTTQNRYIAITPYKIVHSHNTRSMLLSHQSICSLLFARHNGSKIMHKTQRGNPFQLLLLFRGFLSP